MFQQRKPTIRMQLFFLVIACVLPVWLIAALMGRHAYLNQMGQVREDMLESARAMTLAVDRELADAHAALAALATSPSFRNRDLSALHLQSREIVKNYPGADIIIADGSTQQLVNTYRPPGSKLPKRNSPDTVNRIFEGGRHVVSDLFRGAVTGRPVVAIDVPVLIDGKVAYDLSMAFPSRQLSSVLQNQVLGRDWRGTLVDRNGVIIAGTGDIDQSIGKSVGGELRAALARASEGELTVRSGDGATLLCSFSKSAYSGWSVAFEIPTETAMRQINLWVGWAVWMTAGISLIGILLATWLAGAITKDIHSLVGTALAIGHGEPVTGGAESIKETSEVAEAMVQAAQLLHQRAAERDQAERQLSLTIEDLRRETAERIRTMEELRRQEQLLTQQSRQAALGEMIGNIAHQWRQPLNALGLLVQQPPLFYETGQVDQEFLEQNAQKSMRIVNHMSQTIDDFRNFFRPDKEKSSFKISGEVSKTLSLIEGNLQSLNVSLEVRREGDSVIEGYPNEFAQVLLNLLLNARDAVVEREVAAPKVVIAIGEEDGKVVVSVTDNAGGIPEEIMDRIFDPYFTTKGPQSGTGVGLFMAKTIIEKNMGGTLTARNVEGGAQFRIEV